MKIAIHHKPGTYSDRWIEYCKTENIEVKLVNAYDTNIVSQLMGCDGFMWRWHHDDYRDQLIARELILALETIGLPVFPNSNTSWHYDDKLGQKYLLESVNAPFVKSHIFYTEQEALSWAENTNYPKVFKLRGGAGSQNVKLVNKLSDAKRLIVRSFRNGFPPIDRVSFINDAIWKFRRKSSLKNLFRIGKRILTVRSRSQNELMRQTQKGYVYFQDFIENNKYDDRLVVIGNRCFGIRRLCRDNDFRASGSGLLEYKKDIFPESSIALAFKVARMLKTQSVAFDIIYLKDKTPIIIEISYAFAMGQVYDKCDGYWNEDLVWQDGNVNPQIFMVNDFIDEIRRKKR